jgi:hypothetical protein
MRQPFDRLLLPVAAAAALLAAVSNAGAQVAAWKGSGEGLWIDAPSWSTGISPGDPNSAIRYDVILPSRQQADGIYSLALHDTRIVRSLTTQTGLLGGIFFINNGGYLQAQPSDTQAPGAGTIINNSVTLTTNQGLTYAHTFLNNGQLLVSAAGHVAAFSSGPSDFDVPRLFENRGTVDANTGSVSADGTLRNLGAMTLRQGSTLAALQVENAGSLSLSTGSSTFSGDFKNSGTVTIGAASRVQMDAFFGSGIYVQAAGATTLDGGTLDAPAGIAVRGGRLQGAGDLVGAVTVDGGTLAAGHSPGTMELDSLNLLSGVLEVEIEGTAPGEFDFYRVLDVATIGGGQTLGDTFIDFVFDDLPPNSLDLAFLRTPDIVFDPSDLTYRFFLGDQPLSLAGLYDWSVEMRPTRFGDFLVLNLDRVPGSSPTPAPVPAPPSLGLLAIGLLAFALRRGISPSAAAC